MKGKKEKYHKHMYITFDYFNKVHALSVKSVSGKSCVIKDIKINVNIPNIIDSKIKRTNQNAHVHSVKGVYENYVSIKI